MSRPGAAIRLAIAGSHRLRVRGFMGFSSFAREISFIRLRQSLTSCAATSKAPASVRPLDRAASYASSRCSANSETTSSRLAAGNADDAICWLTSFFQSGMPDSGQAVEGLEEGAPLRAQRSELAAATGREEIVAAVAAGAVGLPAAFHPAAFFHVVEQRIERGEGEFQGSAGACTDLFCDFEAVEGLLGQ